MQMTQVPAAQNRADFAMHERTKRCVSCGAGTRDADAYDWLVCPALQNLYYAVLRHLSTILVYA